MEPLTEPANIFSSEYFCLRLLHQQQEDPELHAGPDQRARPRRVLRVQHQHVQRQQLQQQPQVLQERVPAASHHERPVFWAEATVWTFLRAAHASVPAQHLTRSLSGQDQWWR